MLNQERTELEMLQEPWNLQRRDLLEQLDGESLFLLIQGQGGKPFRQLLMGLYHPFIG